MPLPSPTTLAAFTVTGWMGAYAALAAGLSLIIAQWPIVAAAGDRVRQVGDPSARLGLKRAVGWFSLANLACLLGSVAGGHIGQAWDALVPLVNDPLFQLAHQEWAIPLELLPFFAYSVAVGTAALWGMNLTPPRPERVRRTTLAALMAGQYVLAYVLAGLVIWESQVPQMGGYERIVPPGQVRAELSGVAERIWYVRPGDGAVRSVRGDGTDGRVEWSGPVPRPFGALWVADSPAGRVLVFARSDRATAVELPGGRVRECPYRPAKPGEPARAPSSPVEVADLLGGEYTVWPSHAYRPAGPIEGELTARQAKEVREFNAAQRNQWTRHYGQGREMPSVPTRPAWADQMQLQTLGPRFLVANYGYRLIVFDPRDGWLGELGVSAEDFAVAK